MGVHRNGEGRLVIELGEKSFNPIVLTDDKGDLRVIVGEDNIVFNSHSLQQDVTIMLSNLDNPYIVVGRDGVGSGVEGNHGYTKDQLDRAGLGKLREEIDRVLKDTGDTLRLMWKGKEIDDLKELPKGVASLITDSVIDELKKCTADAKEAAPVSGFNPAKP